MEDYLILRMLPLQGNQILQAADVCHSVAPFGRETMADDLIVPKIHVQCRFIIRILHIENCHVTDNALQRPANLEFGYQRVWKYFGRFTRFFVLVVLCFALLLIPAVLQHLCA